MHYELYSLLATYLTFLTCTDIELVSQNNCRCKLTAEREGAKKNPDWGLGKSIEMPGAGVKRFSQEMKKIDLVQLSHNPRKLLPIT